MAKRRHKEKVADKERIKRQQRRTKRFNLNACNCAVLAVRCVVTMSELPYMQIDSKQNCKLVSILKQYNAAYNAELLTKYWLNGIKLCTNGWPTNMLTH